MSLIVIKPGIQDTIQDTGRYGYQYLGVNPGGAMDRYSTQVVNMLVGNKTDEAVIEMHFPAAAFLFQQEAIIAIGGADFVPSINGDEVPLWHPIVVSRNSILQFHKIAAGAQCYLAVRGGYNVPGWLDSYSTHIKAGMGGFNGRPLQKDDIIPLKKQECCKKYLSEKEYSILPWHADVKWNPYPASKFYVIPGHEWNWLDKDMKENFFDETFTISNSADRMGYRLNGNSLYTNNKSEIISSAVCFGTIQLLPDGQLIILMADHQTAGGYPRIAHIIGADLPKLSQIRPGEKIQFTMTARERAEELFCRQKRHLQQLEYACTFRLDEFLKS